MKWNALQVGSDLIPEGWKIEMSKFRIFCEVTSSDSNKIHEQLRERKPLVAFVSFPQGPEAAQDTSVLKVIGEAAPYTPIIGVTDVACSSVSEESGMSETVATSMAPIEFLEKFLNFMRVPPIWPDTEDRPEVLDGLAMRCLFCLDAILKDTKDIEELLECLRRLHVFRGKLAAGRMNEILTAISDMLNKPEHEGLDPLVRAEAFTALAVLDHSAFLSSQLSSLERGIDSLEVNERALEDLQSTMPASVSVDSTLLETFAHCFEKADRPVDEWKDLLHAEAAAASGWHSDADPKVQRAMLFSVLSHAFENVNEAGDLPSPTKEALRTHILPICSNSDLTADLAFQCRRWIYALWATELPSLTLSDKERESLSATDILRDHRRQKVVKGSPARQADKEGWET